MLLLALAPLACAGAAASTPPPRSLASNATSVTVATAASTSAPGPAVPAAPTLVDSAPAEPEGLVCNQPLGAEGSFGDTPEDPSSEEEHQLRGPGGAGFGGLGVESVSEGEITVDGRFSPSVVRGIAKGAFAEFCGCLEQSSRRGPRVCGEARIRVRFVLDKSGAVSSATVDPAATTVKSQATVDCVVRGLSSLRFPPPEGERVTIGYSLVLHGGGCARRSRE